MRTKDTNLPLLSSIRDMEIAALEKADEVFVLGWSMLASDTDQTNLIQRAVSRRKRPFSRVVVVNLHPKSNYYRRIAKAFGVSQQMIARYEEGVLDFLSNS